jgi:hypothetical protein
MANQDACSRNLNFVSCRVAYDAYRVDSVRRHLGDRVLDVRIGDATALLR